MKLNIITFFVLMIYILNLGLRVHKVATKILFRINFRGVVIINEYKKCKYIEHYV